MKAMSLRENWIDVAKVIGLMCIFLAHTDPNAPNWVMQLRSFDVVLMVVLSGYLSAKSYHGEPLEYYKKRFFRLIFPTWLFIIGYNFFLIAFGVEISAERWIKCFLLTREGMGYIWVIFVYFLCALLTPLFHYIYQRDKNGKFVVIYSIIILCYEVMCYKGIVGKCIILDYSIGYIIPYGFAYYLGGAFHYFLEEKKCIRLAFLNVIVCISIFIVLYIKEDAWIMTSEYKYPARLYYLSYGLSVSLLTIMILRKFDRKIKRMTLVKFIGSHSLWLYLWHIFIIKIERTVFPEINWLIQYLGLVIASLMITYIWSLAVERISRLLPEQCQGFISVFRG